MSDKYYHPNDYLQAQDICRALGENLAIHFQMTEDSMNREQAAENFAKRQAVLIVCKMLLDEGERIMRATP